MSELLTPSELLYLWREAEADAVAARERADDLRGAYELARERYLPPPSPSAWEEVTGALEVIADRCAPESPASREAAAYLACAIVRDRRNARALPAQNVRSSKPQDAG